MTGDVMDLLQYTFFQHALLGSLLASIACGIIGTDRKSTRLNSSHASKYRMPSSA